MQSRRFPHWGMGAILSKIILINIKMTYTGHTRCFRYFPVEFVFTTLFPAMHQATSHRTSEAPPIFRTMDLPKSYLARPLLGRVHPFPTWKLHHLPYPCFHESPISNLRSDIYFGSSSTWCGSSHCLDTTKSYLHHLAPPTHVTLS